MIPIVMAAIAEPLDVGVVASLAHPGGNVTGLSAFATELAGKRVELLKEAAPFDRAGRLSAKYGKPGIAAAMGSRPSGCQSTGLSAEPLMSETQMKSPTRSPGSRQIAGRAVGRDRRADPGERQDDRQSRR